LDGRGLDDAEVLGIFPNESYDRLSGADRVRLGALLEAEYHYNQADDDDAVSAWNGARTRDEINRLF